MADRDVKFMYPRVYFKKTGESSVIEHRLTHCYLGSADTEEELAEKVKEFNDMTVKEFYGLLMKMHAKIPTESERFRINGKMEKDDEEDWYVNAWSVYTDLFYTRYPKLYLEEDKIAHSVVKTIRTEAYLESKTEREEAERIRKEDEQRYWQEQKEEKERLKEAGKPKEVLVGKIGSITGMEKLKKKMKKVVGKNKTSNKRASINFIDSDDPFG
jgi:hypothetical protein